ncbi:hypothetical protein [Vallitalea guaymasensis]|uniref:Uncharacterized protein n=1 Tax=Vallitalea guaymasensis TaxID=1185412 RepID=A0A8J8SAI8_9FIRM|nr:hypothetical protein [Vallitalea guaymasensis]QUH27773.1 hypothetical protein HYG85_02115 [Vallitalea guaymasensis]
MSIILGLLSLIVSIALPVIIMVFTDFQVIHFSLFFIVPVGAIAVGYVCGFGFFKGLFLSHKKIKGAHFFIGVLMAIICLVSIKYATYYLTCFDEQTQDIVYTLDGDHISNYEIDGYGTMTFFNYNKYLIENTPITFSRRSRTLAEVSNPTFGWIIAIIDYLGIIAGCLLSGSSIKGKSEYCDTCNKYKKSKKIFKIPKANGKAFFDELETLVKDMNMDVFLEEIIQKHVNKGEKLDEYYECHLVYCESCRTASFKFKLFERTSKNKIEENSSFNYNIKVNYDLVRSYIDQNVA